MEFSFIALLYGGFGVGFYSALMTLLTLKNRLRADFLGRSSFIVRPA